MNREELFSLIKSKRSYLCVGLDSDISKMPSCMLRYDDPVFEFNKQIIDATLPYAVAYKPNLAFYESRGIKGLQSLEKTIKYLNSFKNEVFTIADAKRGDIGNTSKQYAISVFDEESSGFNFDAVTVAPYMGEDSVSPFLSFKDKWVIVLALTSNAGSADFQLVNTQEQEPFYKLVIDRAKNWGNSNNMMFVVGATKAEFLKEIRKIVPDHFLLVPGVGAQGGSLTEVARNGLNSYCGLLVNASRSIIFASNFDDFAQKAAAEAKKMQSEMETTLKEHKII
ncbi:MAG: orotidine-5'-phosphate decarboxylase [Lentimicrobiaceae bacterium]|nr:orotidine-5'-phosphate decarboxylase [Lentimicrobiaceae bacterium]